MVVIVVGLTLSSLLDARVGGGHGYSGRSGGSSSGGGGGEGIWFLVHLVIRYPKVGLPIAVIVIAYYFFVKSRNPEPRTPYSTIQQPLPVLLLDSAQRDRLTEQLRQDDKNFSMPLFLDFAQLLFTNTLSFAGKREIQKMKPYLSGSTRSHLAQYFANSDEIRDIVIGSCTVTGIDLSGESENMITLNFEANYTITESNRSQPSQKPHTSTYYLRSAWTLARKKGVVSKGPGEVNKIGCTSCGAPLGDSPDGKCSYCGHDPRQGEITWYVSGLAFIDRTRKSPDISGGYAEERGTSLPTRYQPGLTDKKADFISRYPDFNENQFYDTAGTIFKKLQEAWTNLKWETIRPYETDSLFQSHLYWINLYKKERMRNVLKDIDISNIQLVKIQSDLFYDALTVRIHASMIDYTETQSGNHVGGNTRHPRRFTEYWTFIRRTGTTPKEATTEAGCPNCGNPLKVGMIGKCEYCDSKITNGDFSWVLSQIEQDESYTG